MYKFFSFLFIFNLLIIRANAQEAAALCALVKSTNINSKKNEWSCGNIGNRCAWSGVTCQDGKIHEINIGNFGGLGILIIHLDFVILFVVNIHTYTYLTSFIIGTLPTQIGSLINLRNLYLHDNSFTGITFVITN
jgi:hypothetical protein